MLKARTTTYFRRRNWWGSKDVDVGEAVDQIYGDAQLVQTDNAIKHLNLVYQRATHNNLPSADIIYAKIEGNRLWKRATQQSEIINFFQLVQKNLNGPNQHIDETERVKIRDTREIDYWIIFFIIYYYV